MLTFRWLPVPYVMTLTAPPVNARRAITTSRERAVRAPIIPPLTLRSRPVLRVTTPPVSLASVRLAITPLILMTGRAAHAPLTVMPILIWDPATYVTMGIVRLGHAR